mmetsp:Transcript_43352/g.91057  ORF Transcript_43352/g.91057 Transcript_43352/m.91057 type:complete len:776 (+) Transcript_43352:1353-3680(+)
MMHHQTQQHQTQQQNQHDTAESYPDGGVMAFFRKRLLPHCNTMLDHCNAMLQSSSPLLMGWQQQLQQRAAILLGENQQQQPPSFSNGSDNGVGKAMSLLGGGGAAVTADGNNDGQAPLVTETSSAVITKQRPGGKITSQQQKRKTKQKQQQQRQKKRRKNNTGFYYGIRDDVLLAPPPSTPPSLSLERRKRNRHRGKTREEEEKSQGQDSIIVPSTPSTDDDDNDDENAQSPISIPSPKKETLEESSPQQQRLPKQPSTNNKNTIKPKKKKGVFNNNNNKQQKKQQQSQQSQQPPGMSNLAEETLLELREMRDEIVALREELRAMKDKLRSAEGEGGSGSEGAIIPKDSKETEGKGGGSSWWQPQQKTPPKKGRPTKQAEELAATGEEDHILEDDKMDQQHPEELLEQIPIQEEQPSASFDSSRSNKRKKFERIGKEVEKWAIDVLFEDEEDDEREEDEAMMATTSVSSKKKKKKKKADEEEEWKEITCNGLVKKKFNKDGRTRVYLKWMPDSREEQDMEPSTPASTSTYPCLKCYATIDAPLHRVCSFLADEDTVHLYNELVVDHADVEELSPNSKITWTKCPKILFVKPRDFVTYCSHWWYGDGTQVVVNQACEHEDRPGVMIEGQGDVCRGFAIRGANFISKDPDDPNKTRITMVSHANPGGGLPQWAMNTAVNAVVQIEPFKFFHNINESVCNYYQEEADDELNNNDSLQQHQQLTLDVGNELSTRSNKPAGIAHLGFTCFWPKGGGLKDESENPVVTNLHPSSSPQEQDN